MKPSARASIVCAHDCDCITNVLYRYSSWPLHQYGIARISYAFTTFFNSPPSSDEGMSHLAKFQCHAAIAHSSAPAGQDCCRCNQSSEYVRSVCGDSTHAWHISVCVSSVRVISLEATIHVPWQEKVPNGFAFHN